MDVTNVDIARGDIRQSAEQLENIACDLYEVREMLEAENVMYTGMVAERDRLRAMLRPLLRNPVEIFYVNGKPKKRCRFCRKGCLHLEDHEDNCPVLTEAWAKES